MNLVTSTHTFATAENARIKLRKVLEAAGTTLDKERWLIAIAADGRFVPVLVGIQYVQYAHHGVMVVN